MHTPKTTTVSLVSSALVEAYYFGHTLFSNTTSEVSNDALALLALPVYWSYSLL